MTRSISAAPRGFMPGAAQSRSASFTPASYDAASHSVEAVLSAGSPVRRWGVVETLSMDPASIDLGRVEAGQVRLLDTHNRYEIEAILGSIRDVRLENGVLMGRLEFAQTEAGINAEAMVSRGELTGVSIGYTVQTWTNISIENDTIEIWRADRWTLTEASLCAVPADPVAGTRSAADFTGRIAPTQETEMTTTAPVQAGNTPVEDISTRAAPPVAPASVTQPAPVPVAGLAARALTTDETLNILAVAEPFGLRGEAETLIRAGNLDAAAIGNALMERAAANQRAGATIGGPARVAVGVDETETRRQAMEDALAIRIGAGGEPNAAARGFMDHFNLVDFAADRLGHRGRIRGFGEGEEVLRRAMHSTSDFPILLENAINRSLRARYQVQAPTYRRIASERTYNDFRPHISVRDGDFPQMKEVKESGEIQGGTFGESKETTSVKAYAIQVGFTRQLLVNDNLNAIERVINNRATSVARFEEETFYAMMLAAAGAGPTLLETTRAVFNTTEGTLAAAAAAITTASVALGRANLRKMKTKDGTFINTPPTILLVGPDKETEAQQLLTAIMATQLSNVNVFSGKLEPVVTAQLTGNQWYLFCDPNVGVNFEWGLLQGFSAPRMRMDEPFGVQGMKVSLEHDFGCGAIDYRFGYRNAGV